MATNGRLLQTSGIRSLKELSPCCGTLPCPVLNRQEDPSVRHVPRPWPPAPSQHRDGGSQLVQPCLDHHAVQQQIHDVLLCQAAVAPWFPVPLHRAPSGAHQVFADRSLEESEQRLLHPPRMGACQISRWERRLRPSSSNTAPMVVRMMARGGSPIGNRIAIFFPCLQGKAAPCRPGCGTAP